MRVVTWNMAHMKPGRFTAFENRKRQWALLAAMCPDVALLQECNPDGIERHAPAWMTEEYDIIGEKPDGWRGCSAILCRKPLDAVEADRSKLPATERRWLEYLSGYIATAVVPFGDEPVAVASVHTVAKEVTDPAVTQDDHERIRRSTLQRAWHNDLAVAALTPWVEGGRFLVGGDWNNAVLFDTTLTGAEGGPGTSAEFFARRADCGWHHALRKFSAEEVRTYLEPASAPYELDHIFTDPALHESLTQCEVVASGALIGLSDHAPLFAVFDID